MHTSHSRTAPGDRWLNRFLSRHAEAPLEIYGASDRGCPPGGDYLYRGFRYVRDPERDVLVREDVRARRS